MSSVKRWCKRYDGTWRSLAEGSHRPNSNPHRHTPEEETIIKKSFKEQYLRFGWDGTYDAAVKAGYNRSFGGMVYAARRMGLGSELKDNKPPRTNKSRYPELIHPGEKVQIDVKEVPYACLRGALRRDGKHLYQWTAIDECTRIRFVYGFEEHTPENTVKFLKMRVKAFPFPIKTIQTDNGTEFTYIKIYFKSRLSIFLNRQPLLILLLYLNHGCAIWITETIYLLIFVRCLATEEMRSLFVKMIIKRSITLDMS